MKKLIAGFATLLFASCYEPPPSVRPVRNFNVNHYLGKWYEVARIDNSFERGLNHTTAEYSLRDDGGITVVNKGYDQEKKEWSSISGRAYFVSDSNKGHLRVSFFRPFYGAYVIFGLDSSYQHSFISGGNLDYLWFLSRSPVVDSTIKAQFIKKAASLGFATDRLLWVKQDSINP